MDPDEALAGMRELVRQYRHDEVGEMEAHVEALADQFEALDEWLTGGGFPPKDWIAKETIDMPGPNIGDTCCGKCEGGTCYVDQVTGA